MSFFCRENAFLIRGTYYGVHSWRGNDCRAVGWWCLQVLQAAACLLAVSTLVHLLLRRSSPGNYMRLLPLRRTLQGATQWSQHQQCCHCVPPELTNSGDSCRRTPRPAAGHYCTASIPRNSPHQIAHSVGTSTWACPRARFSSVVNEAQR